MSEPSAKSFLKLLERSGIVAENRLKQELSNLSGKVGGRTVNTTDLVNHLVDSGLITQWHSEKLLAGKYKGFFLGKYKLLRHLGSGGMSSVYLAQHRISEQYRAIKVLPRKKVADKSYLDRFYLEARAAASLNHQNVVRIYDICNESDTHYMVMEYVKGKDLHDMVRDGGPLDLENAARYAAQAAEGLTHAHERELVHRDIKPANLLKTDDGEVKILDLGLALVNQEDDESLTVLHNEKVMGTADYLSPEQAVNSHNVDHRADIYSLGCTLYYLITGRPPFNQGTLAQRIAKHQTQEPPDIRESRPECPATLVEICQRMMKKKADDRYPTCAAVKSDLLALVASGQLSDISVATTQSGGFSAAQASAQPNLNKMQTDAAPFAIDTFSIDSGRARKGPSSKKLRPATLNRRRKKSPPKWFLPLLIAVMFVILVAVLAVAWKLIKDNAPAKQSERTTVSAIQSTRMG